MSRFEYKREGCVANITAVGNLFEVAAEIGSMIQGIHDGVKTQSPVAAIVFRKAMQSIMEDDSPTWEAPKAQNGEAMIAMVTESERE